jgi:hypothetical protein
MKYESPESMPHATSGRPPDSPLRGDEVVFTPPDVEIIPIVVTDVGTRSVGSAAPELRLSDTPELSYPNHEATVSDMEMPEELSLQADYVSPPVGHDQPTQSQEPEATERDQSVTPLSLMQAAARVTTGDGDVTPPTYAHSDTTAVDTVPNSATHEQVDHSETTVPSDTGEGGVGVGQIALNRASRQDVVPTSASSGGVAEKAYRPASDGAIQRVADSGNKVPANNATGGYDDRSAQPPRRTEFDEADNDHDKDLPNNDPDNSQDAADLPIAIVEQRGTAELLTLHVGTLHTIDTVAANVNSAPTDISHSVDAGNLVALQMKTPEGVANDFQEDERRLPEQYLQAVWDFQQHNNIEDFVEAADRYAATAEGQNLAWGIRAEHLDTIRAFAEQQNGFLTIEQAAAMTGLSHAVFQEQGFTESASSMPDSIGVRPEIVIGAIRWEHQAFTSDRITPKQPDFYDSYDLKSIFYYSTSYIRDFAHELAPAWQFQSSKSKMHYPAEYIDNLHQFSQLHPHLKLLQAATAFAQQNPHLHTILRGQFESYLDHLASQNDGHITITQAAPALGMVPRSLMRMYGIKPDARGHTLDSFLRPIRWSFPGQLK